MAPKSPWNKNNTNQKSNKHGSHVSAASPIKEKINYTEVQDEEVEVLRAIYMDDYQDVETKVAWSTTSERAFKLRLRAFSDRDTSVVLSVKLTATYPRTLPLLSVEELDNLRPATSQNIKSLIVPKSKELLGEVMIHAISTEIQEILEDAVQTREHGALPSLEEERAVHVAALSENARKQEEDEVKRKEDAKADEDRVLKQMLDQELSRRESKQRNKLTLRQVRTDANDLHFSENDTKRLAKGPVTEVFAVLSSALQDSSALTAGENASLVLKRVCATPHQKQMITTLENELEALKKLRHPSVVRILDYAIEKSEADDEPASEQWEIRILTDYANKGPLSELLDFWGPLQVEKVRSCSIELLEALDFYHRNGIVHGRIHANNVLVSTSSGVTSFQLADAGFQDMLYDIKSSPDRVAVATSKSAYWLPPETIQGQAESTRRTRKTDIWEFGVVFLQLLFGLRVTLEYTSPTTMLETLRPSEPLEDMVRNIFRPDPKKRPSAFDLIPCEFLRNSVSILDEPSPQAQRRFSLATTDQKSPHNRRSRHGSSGLLRPFSRYATDFVEMARLGKGGYGEVVKVRNKTDGGVYAIKKIKQRSASALTETLSEVMLLQRLNHPYVVRYYSAWVEDDVASIVETDEDVITTTEEDPSSELEEASSALNLSNIDFGYSTGGLDFVSSGQYPQVDFEEDEDEGVPQAGSINDDETTSDDSRVLFEKSAPKNSDERANLERTRSNSRAPRPTKTTLYIQMEYCEKLTLRDLIRKGLYDHADEVWRLFRQIVEGLAHIHSHGIIHRDLKPDNIFVDVANNPRIGDFGLATSGQYQRADTAMSDASVEGDMTRSIGTALYVAPELRSNASGSYNDKVDMYSLGIIFFEMCYPLKTAMERDQVLKQLRNKHHALPPEFQTVDKDPQGTIINLLITHRPSERPSSAELLRSGKLPLLVEDETIRQALQGLSDSGSPYYQKMMSALFSQTPDKRVKDFAWDMSVNTVSQSSGTNDLRLKAVAKARLCSVFRLHGAEEAQRQLLFPRSSLYTDPRVVQLLDVSGNLVQLPYDLTLPHARKVAREVPAIEKTFAFGDVYRDDFNGGAPRINGEVDFDIVSHDTLDSALKEAEILKTMDEALDQFPFLPRNSTCFHLNHWDLLELIMEFCRISVPQRPAVKEILSNLNIHRHTWQTIRADLRSPALNVSTTSLDDLARFDFRDTPDKAFNKLKSIFEGSSCLDRTHAIFGHLNTVLGYARQFGIVRKTFISPLSNYNEKFYAGGIMFQCLYDRKSRYVLAAGGRYDRLIDEHRPKVNGRFTGCRAVGFKLGWDSLVSSMVKYQKDATKTAYLKKSVDEEWSLGPWNARRCDVLVAAFDPSVLRSIGVRIVADLWAHNISAELASDAKSMDELIAHYREDKHSWVVLIKHDTSSTVRPDLKVRSTILGTDTDVRSSELISYLRVELRDRDHREGIRSRRPLLQRQQSQPDPSHGERKSNVDVLLSQYRSKKSNKWNVVEAAQQRWSERIDAWKDAPILAVETRDEVLDLVRDTRLSDPDSWRRVVQSVPLAERQYLGQVHELLRKYATRWREEDAMREACVYNFRTGYCIFYDLGL